MAKSMVEIVVQILKENEQHLSDGFKYYNTDEAGTEERLHLIGVEIAVKYQELLQSKFRALSVVDRLDFISLMTCDNTPEELDFMSKAAVEILYPPSGEIIKMEF